MSNKFNFDKKISVDGDVFQLYGYTEKVLSVSYTSNTKVRATNQVFAINGTLSGASSVTSSVEEFTDLWLRQNDGKEINIRFKGRLPAREGHTIDRIFLAGKKVIKSPDQVGTLDPTRYVPYSLFNRDTGNYVFVHPTKVFTQTGESVGWAPRPDAITWIVLLFSILLWGIGLIPIAYVLYKAYKVGDMEQQCLEIQKKIEAELEQFLRDLKDDKVPAPVYADEVSAV